MLGGVLLVCLLDGLAGQALVRIVDLLVDASTFAFFVAVSLLGPDFIVQFLDFLVDSFSFLHNLENSLVAWMHLRLAYDVLEQLFVTEIRIVSKKCIAILHPHHSPRVCNRLTT